MVSGDSLCTVNRGEGGRGVLSEEREGETLGVGKGAEVGPALPLSSCLGAKAESPARRVMPRCRG